MINRGHLKIRQIITNWSHPCASLAWSSQHIKYTFPGIYLLKAKRPNNISFSEMDAFKHLTLCAIFTTMLLVVSVSSVPSRFSMNDPSSRLEGKDSRDLLVDINIDVNTKPKVEKPIGKRFQKQGESTSNIIGSILYSRILSNMKYRKNK